MDRRLRLGREVDGLGVAAALEVEHAVVGPAVLIVADQHAGDIGGERGLAGARQAEEHRRLRQIAHRMVGRAVHRHHALGGQDVVEQREHRLLDLAGVGRAADQHHLALEADGDHRLGAAAMPRRDGLEARQVDDGELGVERRKLIHRGAAQHVAAEQRVPRQLADHAHVEAMRGRGAGVEILHMDLGAVHVRHHVLAQRLERLRRHARVGFPPDMRLDRRLDDDMLVARRAAGVLAGLDHQRAADAQRAFAALDRHLRQRGNAEVVVRRAHAHHAAVGQTPRGIEHTGLHQHCSRIAQTLRPAIRPRSALFHDLRVILLTALRSWGNTL